MVFRVRYGSLTPRRRGTEQSREALNRTTGTAEAADVAQLVAHHLAKVRVAGSNPVVRSKVQVASIPAVEWPSGEATACKAMHTGSIPVSTSEFATGAISSAGERFPDTEEVTGSIPVSRTRVCAGGARFMPGLRRLRQ